MGSYSCVHCGKVEFSDSLPRRGAVCFGCHLKTIRIGFTHGKKDFHGPTIRQRQEEQVRVAAANGIKAEPVGSRWV